MHRAAFTTKNYLTQNVNHDELEKSGVKFSWTSLKKNMGSQYAQYWPVYTQGMFSDEYQNLPIHLFLVPGNIHSEDETSSPYWTPEGRNF